MTMPGLPKQPAAEAIYPDEGGNIRDCFDVPPLLIKR